MKLFEKLNDKFFPQYEGNEQEKMVIEIVKKVINLPTTNKIMFDNYSGYFSNEEENIFISYTPNNICIINGDKCIDMECSGKFSLLFENVIRAEIGLVIEKMNSKIYCTRSTMLNDINLTISK